MYGKIEKFIFFLLLFAIVGCASVQERDANGPTYPGKQWEDSRLEILSPDLRKNLRVRLQKLDSAAFLVVYRGRIEFQWGETARKFKVHSIRKSILSALFGIHVKHGEIDLEESISSIGIDDKDSLSQVEKTARVSDLLKSRSCIYHVANSEPRRMKRSRPKRHSCSPGDKWHYNNWDFNALGTIFNIKTEKDLFKAFQQEIANPLQMEDFVLKDTEYVSEEYSIHPAYHFYISARDLARFGLLYSRGGEWRNTQVVPESWIKESLRPHSVAGSKGAYGYMWWISKDGRHLPGFSAPKGVFTARGHRGHFVYVDPSLDLVIVHRVNTFKKMTKVNNRQFGRLLSMVYSSFPKQ